MTKFCKDCRHCVLRNEQGHTEPRCAHPAVVQVDLVLGNHRMPLCESVRSGYAASGPLCDREGYAFEPKVSVPAKVMGVMPLRLFNVRANREPTR